jgi:hypothetical protein
MSEAHSDIPEYSPAVQQMLDEINGARYPSQLRGRGHEIAQLAGRNEIKAEEVDVIFSAVKRRTSELKAPHVEPPEDLPEQVYLPAEEWSPTQILDTLPQGDREPDWRERQLPNGDRD